MEILGRGWHRVIGLCFLAIVVVLGGMMVVLWLTWPPCGGCSIAGARERALREELYTLRSLLDEYAKDHNRRATSLSDLVRAGYIKKLPIDPMTQSRDTWVGEQSRNPHSTGIVNVHSGSARRSSDGSRYDDW